MEHTVWLSCWPAAVSSPGLADALAPSFSMPDPFSTVVVTVAVDVAGGETCLSFSASEEGAGAGGGRREGVTSCGTRSISMNINYTKHTFKKNCQV